jgi:hypothetical protein
MYNLNLILIIIYFYFLPIYIYFKYILYFFIINKIIINIYNYYI